MKPIVYTMLLYAYRKIDRLVFENTVSIVYMIDTYMTYNVQGGSFAAYNYIYL